jgi:hypothetical protein
MINNLGHIGEPAPILIPSPYGMRPLNGHFMPQKMSNLLLEIGWFTIHMVFIKFGCKLKGLQLVFTMVPMWVLVQLRHKYLACSVNMDASFFYNLNVSFFLKLM